MKLHAFYAITALICAGAALGADDSALVVHFFGSATCGECLTIRNKLLKPLSEKYRGNLDVRIHDIKKEKGFQLLMDMENEYGVLESSAEELYVADTFLMGYKDIMSQGKNLIESRIKGPKKIKKYIAAADTSIFTETLQKKFRQFSIFSIILAGLADGVNPCAIATMIFLISFLATQKRTRLEVLIIGMTFTAAVFLTYLLMGLGAFQALTFLSRHLWISQAIKWAAVVFAGVVGIFCFYDAIKFRKTKKARDIKLQLPSFLKMRIHRVISGHLSRRSLVAGAISAGFLVTILEAVCTGQMYLPTIVLMTRNRDLMLTGWIYLVLYNFLFVLPLLIIMVLGCYGLTWEKLSKMTQSHLSLLKVLLGAVLISLAVFLAISI